MQNFTEIIQGVASIPVMQFFAVIVLVALAERVGIPVISMFKALMKMNGHGPFNGSTEAIKSLIEQVLASQAQLAGHFNHETTGLLTEIRDNTLALPEIHEHARASRDKLLELEKHGFPVECKK